MKRLTYMIALTATAIGTMAALPAMARPWHDDWYDRPGYHHGWGRHETIIVEESPPPVIVERRVIVHEAPPPIIVHEVPPPPREVIVTESAHVVIDEDSREVLFRHMRHQGKHARHHHYEIGRQLSADHRIEELPYEILELLNPVPQGYHYARVDDDILLLSSRGNVIDVAPLR